MFAPARTNFIAPLSTCNFFIIFGSAKQIRKPKYSGISYPVENSSRKKKGRNNLIPREEEEGEEEGGQQQQQHSNQKPPPPPKSQIK